MRPKRRSIRAIVATFTILTSLVACSHGYRLLLTADSSASSQSHEKGSIGATGAAAGKCLLLRTGSDATATATDNLRVYLPRLRSCLDSSLDVPSVYSSMTPSTVSNLHEAVALLYEAVDWIWRTVVDPLVETMPPHVASLSSADGSKSAAVTALLPVTGRSSRMDPVSFDAAARSLVGISDAALQTLLSTPSGKAVGAALEDLGVQRGGGLILSTDTVVQQLRALKANRAMYLRQLLGLIDSVLRHDKVAALPVLSAIRDGMVGLHSALLKIQQLLNGQQLDAGEVADNAYLELERQAGIDLIIRISELYWDLMMTTHRVGELGNDAVLLPAAGGDTDHQVVAADARSSPRARRWLQTTEDADDAGDGDKPPNNFDYIIFQPFPPSDYDSPTLPPYYSSPPPPLHYALPPPPPYYSPLPTYYASPPPPPPYDSSPPPPPYPVAPPVYPPSYPPTSSYPSPSSHPHGHPVRPPPPGPPPPPPSLPSLPLPPPSPIFLVVTFIFKEAAPEDTAKFENDMLEALVQYFAVSYDDLTLTGNARRILVNDLFARRLNEPTSSPPEADVPPSPPPSTGDDISKLIYQIDVRVPPTASPDEVQTRADELQSNPLETLKKINFDGVHNLIELYNIKDLVVAQPVFWSHSRSWPQPPSNSTAGSGSMLLPPPYLVPSPAPGPISSTSKVMPRSVGDVQESKSSSSAAAASASASASNTDVIIGGTIGGVMGAAVLAGVAWMVVRKRRERNGGTGAYCAVPNASRKANSAAGDAYCDPAIDVEARAGSGVTPSGLSGLSADASSKAEPLLHHS